MKIMKSRSSGDILLCIRQTTEFCRHCDDYTYVGFKLFKKPCPKPHAFSKTWAKHMFYEIYPMEATDEKTMEKV